MSKEEGGGLTAGVNIFPYVLTFYSAATAVVVAAAAAAADDDDDDDYDDGGTGGCGDGYGVGHGSGGWVV